MALAVCTTSLAEQSYGAKLIHVPIPLKYLKRDPVMASLIRRYPEQILPPAAETLFEPLVKTVYSTASAFFRGAGNH